MSHHDVSEKRVSVSVLPRRERTTSRDNIVFVLSEGSQGRDRET